jgi:predicted alpha/beta superfamily hydrolase
VKKLLLFLAVSALLAVVGYNAFFWYHDWKREQEYEAFMAQATNTASENVSVYRDSISIGYQNDKRTIHVYLPPGYAGQADSIRYPVIYMMDGSGGFNELENGAEEWQVDEVIDSTVAAGGPGAIVIGIESADNRDNEYTPWPTKDIPDAHGKQYFNWFVEEFKPWIDANFRTLPDAEHTTIGGISRSGMMAYYAIMAHPETFGQALIQSPSMWVDEGKLLAMEPAGDLSDKRVWVSVGELEAPMVPLAQKAHDRLAAAGVPTENRKMTVYPGLGHWHLTWRKSFAEGYPWLME